MNFNKQRLGRHIWARGTVWAKAGRARDVQGRGGSVETEYGVRWVQGHERGSCRQTGMDVGRSGGLGAQVPTSEVKITIGVVLL